MEDLIDDYIRESSEDIWFLDLIEELTSYGTKNTDRAMAFGICLIHNIDNFRRQARQKEEKVKDIGFSKYRRGPNGMPIKVDINTNTQENYTF